MGTKRRLNMKKSGNGESKVLGIVAWLTGVIVSLAVGFSMTAGGSLNSIPYIPAVVTSVAGWIVIVTTVISAVLAIIDSLS